MIAWHSKVRSLSQKNSCKQGAITLALSISGLFLASSVAFAQEPILVKSDVLPLSQPAPVSVSQASDSQDKIKFFYVHGTNMNSEKHRDAFLKDVTNLHAALSHELPKSAAFQDYVLKQGQLSIDPVGVPFFWGFLSAPEISFLERQLTITESINTFFAKRVRRLLGYILHDVNWVEQTPNKTIVSQSLQQDILNTAKNQPVILFGHSAGSLVVLNYLSYRLSFIELSSFFRSIHASPEAIQYFDTHPQPLTCLQALLDVQTVRYDSYGRLKPFFVDLEPEARAALYALGESFIEKKIQRLNEATQTTCLPASQFKGLVTFGSPISVFQSSIGNPNQSENYLMINLLIFMMEHGIFWLHVNHLQDPIGFSLTSKDSLSKIEAFHGEKLSPVTGFLYSNNEIKSGANLFGAHGWYWQKPKAFAKALRKAFDEGVKLATDYHASEAPKTEDHKTVDSSK
ncbi:MAG: hypothetical protein VKK59_06105 [Vampirovibrionales bacterium]|nr:hypothetical protein [Vampirovibrionales bacterium]